MKIIVWLWNPGKEYEKTKHNVGFLFLDYFKEKYDFSEFNYESKFKWKISNWFYLWEKSILLKPQTYMNLSWESVRKIFDFYKINIDDLIIIYDDLSMDFWKIRFRDKWNAWWHNWIKSIIKFFSENFKRIKIWIGFNNNFEVSNWVLSKFSEEELIDFDRNIFLEVEKLLEKNS